MNPSWWWSWLRVWVTEKRFVKMNIRVTKIEMQHATTPCVVSSLDRRKKQINVGVTIHENDYPQVAGSTAWKSRTLPFTVCTTVRFALSNKEQ